MSRSRESIRYRTNAEVRSAVAVIAFNALDPQETFVHFAPIVCSFS
jgi:hypothetical protein